MPAGYRMHVIARLRQLRRDERGFSLIEVLVASLILMFMLGAILMVLDETSKQAPRDQERAEVIQETQIGVNRMTRELRHAYKVETQGQWSITVRLPVAGSTTGRQITYDCSVPDPDRPEYRRCMRTEGGGGARPVVTRVLLRTPPGGGSPPPVFEYSQNAAGRVDYVEVTVATAAQGDLRKGFNHAVTLKDGFFLRNVDICGPSGPVACP